MVGGSGKDDLYGGWGDDLMNLDDNQDTNSGLNDRPDTHPSYEDRAYGGAGRDILIANTGGDRLIDWAGEFNSYLVPFAAFGAATISRALQPQLMEFLYSLSASDGADPTRASDTGSDAVRNGEPDGELGLVKQSDFAWHDQTGAPDDPQPGNIPGGRRDVLRSASFNDGQAQGFVPDSGTWTVQNARYEVAPEILGGDAVSVFYVDALKPSYFEVQATINAVKASGGYKANAYLIFDYQGPSDFKFAGVNPALNKLQIGHRTATEWIVDVQSNMQLKEGNDYNVLLAINGTTVTLLVDNKTTLSYAFAPRVISGFSYGLNNGMVGIGAQNARGAIDNVTVQILPPAITLDETETFNDGIANRFTGSTLGNWQAANGRYNSSLLNGADLAASTLNVTVAPASLLQMDALLNTQKTGGVVFDYYNSENFKYAAIIAGSNQIAIGHHTRKGWFTDALATRTIVPGTDYTLSVSLKGTTISVSLNGQAVLGFVYNSLIVDGQFGVYGKDSGASFDSFTFRTDDPALKP
jgi:hypothetical protein